MGRAITASLKDPFEIAKCKAHTYLYKGRYPQIVVFTKYLTEVLSLEKEFGGNHYKHGVGFTWMLTRQEIISNFIDKMKPHLPSRWGFELELGY